MAKFTLAVTLPAGAPQLLQAFWLTHLDVQRFRTLPDLDRTELARLVAQIPADATSLLATYGAGGGGCHWVGTKGLTRFRCAIARSACADFFLQIKATGMDSRFMATVRMAV